ncbi:MAG: hypothetical protein KDH94_06105 [Coxiellaceae bacterium]|nr:hypothetical protein [Coxiellaceae bacterium]
MRLLTTFKQANTLFLISISLTLLVIFQLISQINSVAVPAKTPPLSIVKAHNIPLSHWHLFGKFDKRFFDAPKTQLPLTLQGTIVDRNNTNQSYALINENNQTKLYRVGSQVAGATIQTIEHNKIILKNHGELESLSMPIKKLP